MQRLFGQRLAAPQFCFLARRRLLANVNFNERLVAERLPRAIVLRWHADSRREPYTQEPSGACNPQYRLFMLIHELCARLRGARLRRRPVPPGWRPARSPHWHREQP
jgi:hypothetical protein